MPCSGNPAKFRKILIANRGEIACRVIRTARRLGIATVAVFSEADARALHVREADEAHPIGPAPAAQSYLRGDVILEVARRTGAQALHPGYGFLSENADFAEACAAAGIAFVGPTPAAIRAMGSKAESKRLMVAAGVPTVPGYHGEAQEGSLLAAEAARIGFPVLIKASAGGGGKGMRPVFSPETFAEELEGARREAKSAFGDDRVLLEKYLQRPRHVEVQVFGDSRGHVVHLHTRDCSIQRRHQKVLEEAPAPDLPDALRDRLHESAIAAARAVGYVNAGTVEFIVEDGEAWFLEMNTRLQVEHPVTEAITGLDLVEWQLRIAAGEAIPAHWPPPQQGHAVEVRLYAEDPAQDFRPATGALRRLVLPETGRVDAGVAEGDAVTAFYDPMIAKLIGQGPDREAALAALEGMLRRSAVSGLATNLPFLRRLAAHPALRRAELDTGFIARHAGALLGPPEPAPPSALARAAAPPPPGPSAWERRDSWRLHGEAERVALLDDGGVARRITLRASPRGMALDGTTLPPGLVGTEAVTEEGNLWLLGALDPYAPARDDAAQESRLSAPIPGRVVRLLAAAGDRVRKGQLLAVLEAMKTEIKIRAPRDGVIDHVGCTEGESVEEGTEIAALKP
ncbi:biotin/lipoyl-binding protein [Roseococcus sp. SYP-B2431]|uniref:acetyl/propionyl/methylcrotonyl-CoA carboxylase subunit alpha n=1 Tax=Roseococcus sp. SYP-B2431 TaxID=2496640 RepID=UPI00103F6BC5|nr:biotin carboxylase N-terminal domain-containing protein [Roseococcus sp. SYP-B2431]TCH99990.1 biotin/lipoyl-binding protein [Roseococcus sp. SYP-B2431]